MCIRDSSKPLSAVLPPPPPPHNKVHILSSLQTSLADPLDLSYFACNRVNVSFAVVGIAGPQLNLQFSPPVEVFVHGGKLL